MDSSILEFRHANKVHKYLSDAVLWLAVPHKPLRFQW